MSPLQNSSLFVKNWLNLFNARQNCEQPSAMFDLQWAMVECLGTEGWHLSPSTLKLILFAEDVEVLWHLRSNVMAALSELHGQTVAQQKVFSLTPRFKGLIPEPWLSKPARASGRLS